MHSGQVAAENEMSSVKLTSCRPGVCTKLETKKVFRSLIQPNLLVFGGATMVLLEDSGKNKILNRYEAEDGYYDLQQQVIILRNLKHSLHHELIYDLTEGKFIYL
jgi:hypothetical protein